MSHEFHELGKCAGASAFHVSRGAFTEGLNQMFRELTHDEIVYVAGGTDPAPGEDGGEIVVTGTRSSDTVVINFGQQSIVYFANPNNYSASGEVYYSDGGMAFENFEACVNHYADEFREQAADAVGALAPLIERFTSIFGDGTPAASEIQGAAEVCQ